MDAESLHIPVMTREVVELLRTDRGGLFVDCTLGMGGHAEAILSANPAARVVGIDRDPEELEVARARLAPFGCRFRSVWSDFKETPRWTGALEGEAPRGILCDLGFSRYHLTSGRGFSFRDDDSLDMRMDRTAGESAADFLCGADEDELARVFRVLGEEPRARRFARAIASRRKQEPFSSAKDLADFLLATSGEPIRRGHLHPATRVFMALRIHVNRELEGLAEFMARALDILDSGGRLAVIAYHSLEDRIVKRAFLDFLGTCTCPPKLPLCACGRSPRASLPFRGALKPGAWEQAANPSARSARLRVAEKP